MAIEFEPRTSKPEAGNNYYIRKTNGGYNNAIKGKPVDECNVLANCVGYSYGRFNEVGKYECCKYLAAVNPGVLDQYADGCEMGDEPKVGAAIVWSQDGSATGGHVGNVEAVIDENTIVTSESHYGGSAFDLNIRQKVDGEFFFKDGYTFKCFIYQPDIIDKSDLQEKYDELNEKYNKLISDTKKQKSVAAKEYTELEQDYNDLLVQYKALEIDSNCISDKYEELKVENKKLNTKCYDLTKKVEEQQKIITNYKIGDVNGDGKVNFADVIYLLLHCINPDKYPIK